MIRDYQAIQKTWFLKGQQKKIPTYGKNAGVKLIGILDYETGAVYCEEHERYDAKVFLNFLEATLKKYTDIYNFDSMRMPISAGACANDLTPDGIFVSQSWGKLLS